MITKGLSKSVLDWRGVVVVVVVVVGGVTI
jgi:hypothetical protein